MFTKADWPLESVHRAIKYLHSDTEKDFDRTIKGYLIWVFLTNY